MIDAVIPVRNREVERVNRSIQSLDRKCVGKIILVDYGSYDLDIMKNANADILVSIERGDCLVWNKSHALNIGIKNFSEADYVACMDCDIIMPDNFFNKASKIIATGEFFVYCNNVKRIQVDYANFQSYTELLSTARDWSEGVKFAVYACGGFQMFPRRWVFNVGGYDETMIYWAGMDTDMLYRAMQTIPVITMPDIILHQDHAKIKFNQCDNTAEYNYAKSLQKNRPSIVDTKRKLGIIKQNRWGEIVSKETM